MAARIARTEVCNAVACKQAGLLVRGDQISFVSPEQAEKVGEHPLDERAMPSDIRLPAGFVLVHDVDGELFGRCELFIVRWRGARGRTGNPVSPDEARVARDYFGSAARVSVGRVEVPRGPWKRVASVRFIRYRRHGFARGFEHKYDPDVHLYSCRSSLAWKLSLPDACIVDERGFVRP